MFSSVVSDDSTNELPWEIQAGLLSKSSKNTQWKLERGRERCRQLDPYPSLECKSTNKPVLGPLYSASLSVGFLVVSYRSESTTGPRQGEVCWTPKPITDTNHCTVWLCKALHYLEITCV